MLNKKTRLLRKTPIPDLLLKMSLPASIGMLVATLYNVVDAIFIGQLIGPLGLTAVSIIFPIMILINAISSGFGIGASSAGYIHFPLANYLKAKRIFILEKPTKKLLSAKHALSPSDILTLRLMRIKKPGEKERLLAARSLIYVALLSKNEMLPSKKNPFPHLSEEARIIKFLRNLNYEECRKYFNMFRFVRREDAWKLLEKEGLL